ncbi:MAG: hypothetical protein M3Y33_06360, partial [Actinomycetota bacterium]|nr:hypothetical protein [Actinomycetota bacterium]
CGCPHHRYLGSPRFRAARRYDPEGARLLVLVGLAARRPARCEVICDPLVAREQRRCSSLARAAGSACSMVGRFVRPAAAKII